MFCFAAECTFVGTYGELMKSVRSEDLEKYRMCDVVPYAVYVDPFDSNLPRTYWKLGFQDYVTSDLNLASSTTADLVLTNAMRETIDLLRASCGCSSGREISDGTCRSLTEGTRADLIRNFSRRSGKDDAADAEFAFYNAVCFALLFALAAVSAMCCKLRIDAVAHLRRSRSSS